MATSFVSQTGFSLPEDALRKMRQSAFLTGTPTGPATTTAIIEAGLNVGAQQASRFAEISAARDLRESELEQQESQFQRSQSFAEVQLQSQKRESEKQRKSAFAGGIAEAATTIAGFGILKYFKII